MNFQISIDLIDLEKALKIATAVEPFVDIFEIGAPLILKEGVKAVEIFKNKFSKKIIFADAKIVNRINESVPMFAKAGADYISILAGTTNTIIQQAGTLAHSLNSKIALDLVDSYSMGQSAMDAQALDVDLIIFHKPYEEAQSLDDLESWENVRENTKLPIFLAGRIDRTNIEKAIKLKPQGIIIGNTITKANNPAKEAEFFRSLIK